MAQDPAASATSTAPAAPVDVLGTTAVATTHVAASTSSAQGAAPAPAPHAGDSTTSTRELRVHSPRHAAAAGRTSPEPSPATSLADGLATITGETQPQADHGARSSSSSSAVPAYDVTVSQSGSVGGGGHQAGGSGIALASVLNDAVTLDLRLGGQQVAGEAAALSSRAALVETRPG
jgi:hypothetical protein